MSSAATPESTDIARSCPPAAPPVVATAGGRAGSPPGPQVGPGGESAGGPALSVVPDSEPLELGAITSELAVALGGHQAVVDVALEAGATGDTLELLDLDGSQCSATWSAAASTWTLSPEDRRGVVLHPQMASRLATADETTTIVIVGGTAATLAATAFSPEGSVVVGVQSPLALDSTALATHGVDTLVTGRRVVLLPELDPAESPPTHSQTKEASDLLTTLGALNVVISTTPTETSLLDFLTGPLADPEAVLGKILDTAKPIATIKQPPLKRRPASGRVDELGDFVSTHLGQIVSICPEQRSKEGKLESNPEAYAGHLDGRRVYATRTLLEAAVTIERIVEVSDDLATPPPVLTLRYGLDIQIGTGDNATHRHIEVADGILDKPGTWRAFAGAEGAAVRLGEGGMGQMGGQRIAEAIRGTITPATPVVARVTRTGWKAHQGQAIFIDATGAHGMTGKNGNVSGEVHGVVAGIDIPDAAGFTPRQVKESVRALIQAVDLFVDPTTWITGLAATYKALSGCNPEACLWVVGDKGSGKSFMVGALASCLGPTFGPKVAMFKPDGTVPHLRGAVHESHNIPLFIDDARQRSESTNGTQENLLEIAARVAYEGGSAVPPKSEQDASGKWVQAPLRRSRPMVCISGECTPPDYAGSTIERLLVVQVTRETSFKPGAADLLKEICDAHSFLPSTAGYLRHRAQVITEEYDADLDAARSALTASTNAAADRSIASHAGLTAASPRVREVTRTFVTGAAIFLDWAAECGAIGFDERDRLVSEWAKIIISAAVIHTATNLTDSTPGDQVLEEIKGQIAAGLLTVGPATNPRQKSVGEIVRVGGIEHVALIPAVVRPIAKSLHITNSLGRAMSPVLNVDRDQAARKVHVASGEKIRAFVVAPEKMDPRFYQTQTVVETNRWGDQEERVVKVPPPPEAYELDPTPADEWVDDFDSDFSAIKLVGVEQADEPTRPPRATLREVSI